ncbi:Vesicle tethering protein Uso1/P115 [Gracilaria domingensis]|nr:Vesicle tethering protein Uso1/P115 [Gracilaria domingensis]
MNYLSGALRYVAGGDSDAQTVVPRLVDRIKTSVLPVDRRTAIQQLNEAAKQSPQRQKQVGSLGTKIIYAVLEQDNEYDETIKAALDLLITICGALEPTPSLERPPEEEQSKMELSSAVVAKENVDAFLALPDSISLILQQLGKHDFYIKFGTIELLTAMAANSRATLQSALLSSSQGVTSVCDMLDDSDRHIRVNAVLLLSTLCEKSAEICKIVAFAGVLEKLFTLLESLSAEFSMDDFSGDVDKDSLEAAIFAHDILLAVHNLLVGTSTTKTFLRDTGCIPKLVSLLQRAAIDAALIPNETETSSARTTSAATKTAFERQAERNLLLSLQCIASMVDGTDEESFRVRNDLLTSNVFRTLLNLGFSGEPSSSSSELALDIRLNSLKTTSMLVRGLDEFRTTFNSSAYAVASGGQATSPQIIALKTMLEEHSSAVRAAAFTLLRDSLLVDPGLDLPSTILLNAMSRSSGTTTFVGESRNLSLTSLSSAGDLASPSNSVAFISDFLKEALVGWPDVADAAGVFYAASLVSWVVNRINGARERLLGCYVNGSSLLPQVLRTIGKLERERGPPEVRIALFSLACVWLYESPSAVSAFLSSAMNLPLLVDTIKKTGTRGDVAEVHTRGLAAVLLGICLLTTEDASDAANHGGFLSGGGPSTVIPRETVANVIRNRVGVAEFTGCLDDLLEAKSFKAGDAYSTPWDFVQSLMSLEKKTGFLSSSGDLGHENWYGDSILQVVGDVYQKVGVRALDLVASPAMSNRVMNGHTAEQITNTNEHAVLADSARDEVLKSYKEFIRDQDENLNAARQEINTLKAALHEAQTELDSRSSQVSASKGPENLRSLLEEKEKLAVERGTLRSLLEEKESDFTALSEAYAALEEEQASNGQTSTMENNAVLSAEIQRLRTQYDLMKRSLEEELHRKGEISHRALLLDNDVKNREIELTSLTKEVEALRSGLAPSNVESLQNQRRAEAAEAKLGALQMDLELLQKTFTELETRMKLAEMERNDALSSLSTLQQSHGEMEVEMDNLRATRLREMKESRESSAAASASMQQEVVSLRQRLANVESELQQERQNARDSPAYEQAQALEHLRNEYQRIHDSSEKMKAELVDTRQAVGEWQRRAQASESIKEQQFSEINRLGHYVQGLESQVRSLSETVQGQNHASNVMSSRIEELQQQCAEAEDSRQRAEDESKAIRDELALRTEQSIRLSGQVFEIEGEKSALEESNRTLSFRIEVLESELSDMQKKDASEGKQNENLLEKINALEDELNLAKETIADGKDRESLLQAKVSDRDAIAAKAEAVERSVAGIQSRNDDLQREIELLNEKMLSQNEAEDAKRTLTLEVVSLRKALQESEQRSISLSTDEFTASSAAITSERDEAIQKLQERENEFSLANESLREAKGQLATAASEITDLEKQVREVETLLSVVQMERDQLAQDCEQNRKQLERLTPSDESTARLQQLEEELSCSERKRADTASELASLIAACKLSEKQSNEMTKEIEFARQIQVEYDQTVSRLHDARQHDLVAEQVQNVVSAVVVNVSNEIESERRSQELADALLSQGKLLEENSNLQEELKLNVRKLDDMEALIFQRERAVAKCSDYEKKLDEMSSEVHGLQQAVSNGNKLKEALEAARLIEERLRAENQSANAHISELQSRFAGSTIETSGQLQSDASALETSASRVYELEEALRDAARTVAATNLELIAAQGLLVEISADKTSMHAQLMNARQAIDDLKKKVEENRHSVVKSATVSEISEADHLSSDDPGVSSAADPSIELSQQLDCANADAENLRSALSNSMTEADSALDLVMGIHESVKTIEHRLKESESSLNHSRCSEESLREELSSLRQEAVKEKEEKENEKIEAEKALKEVLRSKEEAIEVLEGKIHAMKFSFESNSESLEAQIQRKEKLLEEAELKLKDVETKLNRAYTNIEKLEKKTKELEESELKLTLNLNTTENQVQVLQEEERLGKLRRAELQSALNALEDSLEGTKSAFQQERINFKEQRESEARQYEEEIDRLSGELQVAERKTRDSEQTMKAAIEKLSAEKRDVDHRLQLKLSELENEKDSNSRLHEKHSTLEGLLADERERREVEVASLVTEKNELIRTIEKRKAQREILQKNLDRVSAELEATEESLRKEEQARREVAKENRSNMSLVTSLRAQREMLEGELQQTSEKLKRTQSSLKEEMECKEVLERENEDFLSTIESLESTSKGLREDVALERQAVLHGNERILRLEETVSENNCNIQELQATIDITEDKLRDLTSANSRQEDSIQELRRMLAKAESSRDEFEQDNKDLREWVSDLEKQANELESAMVNFEEVERSLRETMELQRQTAEENLKLSEELKERRESMGRMQVQLQQSVREKRSAEAARESSQRRSEELERRIRDIREENLAKFSTTEEAIRERAQRCASLETSLAIAERELAELASVSDELFGVKTTLKQRDSDLETLRVRAEGAERRGEELLTELAKAKGEIRELRESGNGSGLRVLEEEHNELLVYLADLEVEVTRLKEEVGRD